MNRTIHSVLIGAFGLAFLLETMRSIGAENANGAQAGEQTNGWKVLFDGKTTHGWHSFKSESFPATGWSVEDGWLRCLGKSGGDILSDGQFEHFDLQWEWK